MLIFIFIINALIFLREREKKMGIKILLFFIFLVKSEIFIFYFIHVFGIFHKKKKTNKQTKQNKTKQNKSK